MKASDGSIQRTPALASAPAADWMEQLEPSAESQGGGQTHGTEATPPWGHIDGHQTMNDMIDDVTDPGAYTAAD